MAKTRGENAMFLSAVVFGVRTIMAASFVVIRGQPHIVISLCLDGSYFLPLSAPSLVIHLPPTMQATPRIMNGMLSSWPMSRGSEASNAS